MNATATSSRFTRHRLVWFAVAILMLAVPFLWPVAPYIVWRLWAERKNVPEPAPAPTTLPTP